ILVQAPWVQLVDVQEGKALWHWPGRMGRLSPDGQSVVVETSTTDLWKDDRAIRLYRLPPHKPWLSIIFWPLFIGLLVYFAGRRLLPLAQPTPVTFRSRTLLHPDPSRYDINFRLFGVPVRVSPGFWLLHSAIGVLLMLWARHPIALPIWFGCVFFSVLLHEM